MDSNGYSEAFPGMYRTVAEAEADSSRVIEADKQARDAIRTLGKQCLPALVRRLNTRDNPKFKTKLVQTAEKYRLIKPTSRLLKSPAEVRGQAVTAFLQLKPQDGAPAIPQLLRLAKSDDPGVAVSASHVLLTLAPDELKKLNDTAASRPNHSVANVSRVTPVRNQDIDTNDRSKWIDGRSR